jgi:hypothetical protein
MNKLLPISLLLLAVSTAQATNDRIVTAVFSGTYNGYKRSTASDGSPEREYYALANGNFMPGASADASIDKIKFPQVAGLTAQFLALRNYHLAPDGKQAQFLLIITWGKTLPFNDATYRANSANFYNAANQAKTAAVNLKAAQEAAAQGGPSTRGADGAAGVEGIMNEVAQSELVAELFQMKMFEGSRRDANEFNAKLLGYVEEINRHDTPAQFAGAGTALHDLNSDLENERYFFVISAYDFPTAAKTGQRKLLWATRVSIQAQGNKFNEAAGLMLSKASKYFGQNSGRLVQEFEREGKVNLGELKFIGVVPDPKSSPPAEDKK